MPEARKTRISTDGNGAAMGYNPFAALDSSSLREPDPARVRPSGASHPAPKLPQTRIGVRLEKKGRGGKMVTSIQGFESVPLTIREELLYTLKSRFATGGTLQGTDLELQGNHVIPVIAYLQSIGYKALQTGG
jgi:translation initiation factor 1 (eIF-1/SUI1)